MDLILEPGRAENNYWRDLWRYRELFCFLAWRDILVRYKQTVIGVAWAVLRPLLNQKKQPHLPFRAGEPSLITL
jgi:lipopolysaccharide transport system permease protein